MRYNLTDQNQKAAAIKYINTLQDKNIEIIIKKGKKNQNQNKYLHKLILLWAINFNYTVAEAKYVIKSQFSEIFVYTKNNIKFYKSIADLNITQKAVFLDKFKAYSISKGYYLPQPYDFKGSNYYHNLLDTYKRYIDD